MNKKYVIEDEFLNKEAQSKLTPDFVLNMIKAIRAKSPILMEMGNKGEIKIIGAEYHMESCRVDYF